MLHYNNETMHFQLTILISALLALVPAAALAQTVPTPAPVAVLLKYKFTPGEVLRYKYATDTSSAGGYTSFSSNVPMVTHMTAVLTYTVQSVEPATGNATIHMAFGQPTMTMTANGATMPISVPADSLGDGTIVVSPTGAQISMKLDTPDPAPDGSGATSMAASGGSMGQFSQLPDHPVSVGDIWRSVIRFGSTIGGQMYTKQSLLGVSSEGGHAVADIALRYSMDMDLSRTAGDGLRVTGTETGTGREQFDVTDGSIRGVTTALHLDTSTNWLSNKPGVGANKSHTTMTMSMQRVGS